MSSIENWKLKIGNSQSGIKHHAYLLEGAKESILEELHSFLESELKFPTKANPDFWSGKFDTFGIDDGRSIKRAQSLVSAGDRKVFVITTNFFTREAQNSLLKMFEEPTDNTHFFVVMPNSESLLPTLKSRLLTISRSDLDIVKSDGVAVDFIKSSKGKRLDLLKNIVDSKDKQMAIEFLNNLEFLLHEKLGNKIPEKYVFVFEEIIKARGYLNDRSPSIKMLLEHIAIILP